MSQLMNSNPGGIWRRWNLPTHRRMETMIDLGRTWGYIWDTLFAASAASQGDCDEIELPDARFFSFDGICHLS
ncbi:hypothetical protein N7513_007373 [Penicillium frequentans]|nr:hypothetical protein N7513_007373 [Penicillium glabrum]